MVIVWVSSNNKAFILSAKLDANRNSGIPMPCPEADIRSDICLPCSPSFLLFLSILDDHRLQTLGVLDVHSLDVAVQFLLRTLLVIPSPRDAHADSVRDTLHALLPDLLVQLRVDPDVDCALEIAMSASQHRISQTTCHRVTACIRIARKSGVAVSYHG